MQQVLEGHSKSVCEHIVELHSLPQVQNWAHKLGLSLDLTTMDPSDGQPLDFNNLEEAAKVEYTIQQKRLLLLVRSPSANKLTLLSFLKNRLFEKQLILQLNHFRGLETGLATWVNQLKP